MKRPKIALSLNETTVERAKKLLFQLREIDIVKLGHKHLFQGGIELIQEFKLMGKEIFIDLKLMDIPSVVGETIEWLKDIGADYITVHSLGGIPMLKRAVEARRERKPFILAVTVLSSLSKYELKQIEIHGTRREIVLKLAEISNEAGVDGLVASGIYVRELRQKYPKMILVCPGIRPSFAHKNDQRVTLSPQEATTSGCDILVIGRPITQAKDPQWILSKIIDELST